ncbi:MAG TPA: hypothetical protein VLC98_04310 [Phnomibacter sp.]|nr:hypothetical protein [Phnomibacter sp.]
MKPSVLGMLLRATIIVLIIFSVFGLSIQFIFSYFNQSINGPELTFLNFAGPLLLTIAILVFTGQRLLSKNIIKKLSSNPIVTIVLAILLLALMAWQIWYVVTLYKMKAGLDFNRKFAELMPMSMGFLATLFLATGALIQKHASSPRH